MHSFSGNRFPRYSSMCRIVLVFLILLTSATAIIDDFESFTKNVSSTLDALLSATTYDKRLRPDFGGPPTIVEVNMHIKSMGPVSENEQLYKMDVYFRQQWVDGRLKFDIPGLEEFSMSWLFLEKVWKPDTYFLNGKKSHLHRITSPNKFLRLRHDGSIVYSMRLTVSATCKMRLRKFPLDTQKCPLVIGSYGYTAEDLIYVWAPSRVTSENNLGMAQHDLHNISTSDSSLAKRGEDDFSVVSAEFRLRRTIGFFVLQIYVPCSLIVSCSWVSFWINPNDVPGRCSLAMMTVLSITTLGFGGRSQMPQVSYATALDWWVIFCFAFVFAVLVEYAVINFIEKVKTDLKRLIDSRNKSSAEKKADREKEKAFAAEEKRKMEEGEQSGMIPAIHIEVTQYFDDVSTQSSDIIEFQCDQKIKEKSKGNHLDVAGPSRMAQKRWRSVPNVLDTEHLSGIKGTDWLKSMEEKLRKPWRVVARRTLMAPVRYWQSIHFLPREEDIPVIPEDKRFSNIDIAARRLFPLAFSIFVTSYTLLYAFYIVDDVTEE